MTNVRKNISYNIIYQILIILLPLITSPYISRVLGAESLGICSYLHSIVSYFSFFILLGLNNYGSKTIAQVKSDKTNLSKNFCAIFCMQLLSSVIVILIYIVYIISPLCNYKIYSLIQLLYLFGSALNINWFFFGMEKFKLTVIRNTIVKILSVLSIFIFVKKTTDIYIYIIILSLTNLFTSVFLWGFLKKEIELCKIGFKDIKQHIKPNLILFIPIIAVSCYKIMDKIMLGNMSEINQVALYENAEKIIQVPISIVTAIGTVMLPKISNLLSEGKEEETKMYVNKSFDLIMMIAFPMTFGIMAVCEKFMPLYLGAEFTETGLFTKYLAITVIFVSFANVIRTQYLIPKNKNKIFILSLVCGAFVNLIINILLIPKFSGMGAIIGTIFAEFTVMIYQTLAVFKEMQIHKYIKNIVKYFIFSLIMYLIINRFDSIIENDIYCILTQVVMGILIYSALASKEIIKYIKK